MFGAVPSRRPSGARGLAISDGERAGASLSGALRFFAFRYNSLMDIVSNEHIEITPGVVGGKPRISGRRITVEDIAVWHERMGMSTDEIASEYDLSLAEVHAALAYYFDHRAETDESIRAGEAFTEELRRNTPSKLPRKPAARERRG